MKIRELFENIQEDGSLIGRTINGELITAETEIWKGDFDCSFNKNLSSLTGAPQKGVKAFSCNYCNLTSLEGAPKKINGGFSCSSNENLASLKGAPQEGVKYFYCFNCNLSSLEGAPKKINGGFSCFSNKNLTSLKGCPQEGVKAFNCFNCNLSSLEGAPKKINGNFECSGNNNNLISLKNIHKIIEEINGKAELADSIKSNILGLLKIKNLKAIKFSSGSFNTKAKISNIINKYLPNPTPDKIIDCQNELIDAGFEEYAEL